MDKKNGVLGASLFGLILTLVACSGSKDIQSRTYIDKAPNEVKPQDVGSVLIPDSKSQTDTCLEELVSQGAAILYQGSNGLLMVNRKTSELNLKDCTASISDNVEIKLDNTPTRSGTKLADLPTLLRLIPAEEIGARSFVKDNATYDGRGAVVAILDTGVEVDHPMLKKTTTGEDKIVDFDDFSGEGKVSLSPPTEAQKEILKNISGSDFQIGTFKGSSLAHAESVAEQDNFVDFQVVTYLNSESKRRAKIDTNADGSFDDETELANYGEAHQFTKIGAKKSLSVSVQIAQDGKSINLCFDDGSHGTHVAGITAGYDPKGLSGVAPGAKVLGAKIGDNRLSGGSTTTASMLLAIDYAVSKKADIINLSYGIRAGGNLGKSAIDKYIDKVALEKGILFSISAGNEGPGLLTIGTPAGANLAITNGAYVSKQTARDNYGYAAVEDDTIWYFSSVGPRLDGGLKPTLLAPGSALASVPKWSGFLANYRGTSMASPQTTGGLALLLSAASQAGLPKDRASVTRAVYDSAKNIPTLSVVEQGHGLFNVPEAFKVLKQRKDDLAIEYSLSVNSPTSPEGKGAGIFIRSRNIPENLFTVTVTPSFPAGTSNEAKNELKTFRLEPSHDWIKPVSNLWMTSQPKTFQVEISRDVFNQPGLKSGKIRVISEATNALAFVVPVTVVSPLSLNDSNSHQLEINDTVKVGETKRHFIDVPAGTTGLQVEWVTDGPVVWGQLLNSEGRLVSMLRDSEPTAPQPPLFAAANVERPGVYEIDLVAPPNGRRLANVRLKVKAFSLTARTSPSTTGKSFDLLVQNNFEPLKFVPKSEVRHFAKSQTVTVTGDSVQLPIELTSEEAKLLKEISFQVLTSKRFYDLMTDYPYRVFDSEGGLAAKGGMELDTLIALAQFDKLTQGKPYLDITGAFTTSTPSKWFFDITERRVLKSPLPIATGSRVLLETGQEAAIPVNLDSVSVTPPAGMKPCAVITLETPDGKKIQDQEVCF